jgi:hypothetical protein
MARNMIDANISIFKKMADFTKKYDDNINLETRRCIKTTDDEKKWLKNLVIVKEQLISPKLKTALFEFEGWQYFVVVGYQHQEDIELENVVEFTEMNAGIFTALIFELKVPLIQKANYLEMIEDIFYESSEQTIRYELSSVIKFFEPLCVYRIDNDCPFNVGKDEDLIKLSGFYILKNRQLISLGFSSNTLNKFEKIFFEGSEAIPYENLLLSLVSIAWKYSFLDIYRCIERLFCISALEEFHTKLQITYSILQFSTDIEDHIDWRPKEDKSLNKIIEKSPEEATNLLREIKVFVHGEAEGNHGDLMYKIRNSIVHFRGTSEAMYSLLNDLYWDKLINSALLIVEYWYDKYDSQLRI